MRLSSTKAAGAPPARRPAVLLLGNYRPTLVAARALARDGFRIVLGRDHDGEGSAQFSNCVHEIWDHPPLDGGSSSAFRCELETLLAARPDLKVVYPISEAFVRWCAEHDAALAVRVLVASPAAKTVLQCLDKWRMVELAREVGAPCLPFAVAETLPHLYAAADEIGYPVVVRPLSHLVRLGDKKAIIAADHEALRAALPAWPAGQQRLLIQQFARGARHNIYFAARSGEAFRCLQLRSIRTDSRDGTGVSVEGEIVAPSPHLVDQLNRLIRPLDYTGIGCIQFIIDPRDGSTCFLELNPRIAGSHRCAECDGMGLTRLAIGLAAGSRERDRTPFSYRAGRRFAWTYGDLRSLKTAISKKEISAGEALRWLGQTAATFARADFHLTWDWRDPLPTLLLFLGKIAGLDRLARFARRDQASPSLAPAGPARTKISARIPS